MTAVLTDYTNRVTSEHDTQPNFMAVLAAVLQPLVDGQNLLESLPAKFDVDVALGAQLDVVGQWVGIGRKLSVPIAGVYFAFDTPGLGWDEGVWKGPFDPSEGVISLDDATYRLMIYAKIAANIWDGTLEQAEQILANIFASSPGTHVFIEDNTDMSINIGVSGVLPSALFRGLITSGYFELRPAGVRINNVFIAPGPFFGFDTENYNIAGWDVGQWT